MAEATWRRGAYPSTRSSARHDRRDDAASAPAAIYTGVDSAIIPIAANPVGEPAHTTTATECYRGHRRSSHPVAFWPATVESLSARAAPTDPHKR